MALELNVSPVLCQVTMTSRVSSITWWENSQQEVARIEESKLKGHLGLEISWDVADGELKRSYPAVTSLQDLFQAMTRQRSQYPVPSLVPMSWASSERHRVGTYTHGFVGLQFDQRRLRLTRVWLVEVRGVSVSDWLGWILRELDHRWRHFCRRDLPYSCWINSSREIRTTFSFVETVFVGEILYYH